MILLATCLAIVVIFLTGYLCGLIHGKELGRTETYDAVERWYETRRETR